MQYAQDVRRHAKFLSADEEHKIALAAKRGDAKARERLICSQLPYVIHLANKYQWCGMPLDDLVQLGNEGLIRAADKFNPRRRVRGKKRYVRFSTYASWWIKQVIFRELETRLGIIKVPNKCNRRNQATEEQAQKVLAGMSHSVSVNHPHSNLPAPELSDYDAETLELTGMVRDLLPSLPGNCRQVIERRLAGETFKTIGDEIGLTRERIRQIETRAIAILRARFIRCRIAS